jgi:hypothetical protein
MYNNIAGHLSNHCCHAKAIHSVTYYVCVSIALGIQHAMYMYMYHIVCHQWPSQLYSIFPLYLVNGTTSEKKLLNTKCVFFFLQLLPKTFLILRRILRDIMHVFTYSPIILIRF